MISASTWVTRFGLVLFAAGIASIVPTRISGSDGLVGLVAFGVLAVAGCILFPYFATSIAATLGAGRARVQGQGAIPWAYTLLAISVGLALGDSGLMPPLATASLVVGIACIVGWLLWRSRSRGPAW